MSGTTMSTPSSSSREHQTGVDDDNVVAVAESETVHADSPRPPSGTTSSFSLPMDLQGNTPMPQACRWAQYTSGEERAWLSVCSAPSDHGYVPPDAICRQSLQSLSTRAASVGRYRRKTRQPKPWPCTQSWSFG